MFVRFMPAVLSFYYIIFLLNEKGSLVFLHLSAFILLQKIKKCVIIKAYRRFSGGYASCGLTQKGKRV